MHRALEHGRVENTRVAQRVHRFCSLPGGALVDGTTNVWKNTVHGITFAGDDDDHVVGGLGDDYIDGGLANDDLTGHGGHGGNDVIDGGDGNDVIQGDGIILTGCYETLAETQHGNDVLDGGADNDRLIGGGKDDGLFGGAGIDKLYGDDQTEANLAEVYHGSRNMLVKGWVANEAAWKETA